MRNRKLIFFIVLILLGLMLVFGFLANPGSIESVIWMSIIMLIAGIWILLRKRITGEGKAVASPPTQPFVSTSGSLNSSQTSYAKGTQFTGPKVRRDKNFIVEENLDAIQWPQECSWCGGAVEHLETLNLKEKFKDKGQVQAEVVGIPYCKKCAVRAKWTNRLNSLVLILALIIGIALTIFAKIQEITGASDTSTPWWLAFVVCFAIGYGITWLFIKLPFKLVLRKRLVEPVTAWLMEDLKSDGQQGASVVISIPQKGYDEKFAQMNVTAATSSIPVSKVDEETLVRVIQPPVEQPVSEISTKTVEKIEGINSLIDCTRDDVMDTTELWTKAVDDLQQHGEEGSRALADLIEEMLRCRADVIGTAIAMSRNLLPTNELTAALNTVQSARPLTSTIFGVRFRPQIEGGGMIGWTDGTAARIRAAASEALGILEKPLPPRPDVDKMEKERDVQGLIEALSYRTDMRLRTAAAQALGKIGDAQAVGALEIALKDGVSPVHVAATEALGRIKAT